MITGFRAIFDLSKFIAIKGFFAVLEPRIRNIFLIVFVDILRHGEKFACNFTETCCLFGCQMNGVTEVFTNVGRDPNKGDLFFICN